MDILESDPNALWQYYQRGYHCLIRSGLYFRRLVRPALSHVYFQRAVPILADYARANHGKDDLPPGFTERMDACPLSVRDLLHLDYAICLGYAEALGQDPDKLAAAPILDWPGPPSEGAIFIAADGGVVAPDQELDWEDFDPEDDDEDPGGDDTDMTPPFDL